MDLEKLLDDAGGFGRFQLFNLMIVYSAKIFCGWSMFQMTFAGIVPDFICEIGARDDDFGYDVLPVNMTINKCHVPLNATDPTSESTECLAYNYTSPYTTIMKDFHLVCERDWIRPVLTSIQMAGLMVGCMVSGQLGDAIGRWWTILIFVFMHCLGNIAAAFSPNWEVFAVCRFIIGLGIGGVMVVSFIQPMEFMPTKWRPLCACIPAWQVGVAIFALTSYLLQDWRKLHLLNGACGLIQIPFLFLAPESLRWLATHGRIDQAVVVIDKVARWNGRSPVSHARTTLESVYEEQKKADENGKRYTYMSIVRPWPTARITLIICYHWFCYSLSYYGISFGISELAGNFFMNIFILGVVDTAPQIFTLYTNNKIGRKLTALVLVIIAVGSSVACMVLMVSGKGGEGSIVITSLSLLAKTGVAVAWNVMQTWGCELYPTVTRNLGYGAANTTARIAGILAPVIIDFKTRMTESYILIGVLLTVDLVLVLLLPDTKGKSLPDTVNSVIDIKVQNPEQRSSNLEHERGSVDHSTTAERSSNENEIESAINSIREESFSDDKNEDVSGKRAYNNGSFRLSIDDGGKGKDCSESNFEHGDDELTSARV